MAKTRLLKLTKQETEDLFSALRVWIIELDKKENPETHKALIKLDKKISKFCWSKDWAKP